MSADDRPPAAIAGPRSPAPRIRPPGSSATRVAQSPAGAGRCRAGHPGRWHTELSSVGKRFREYCLELVLFIVTLGIGRLISALIILGRGSRRPSRS